MKHKYHQTYYYMLGAIEQDKIYNLSCFNEKQREEILKLFLHEVTPTRLSELNDDHFPEISLEVAFLYPENKSLRYFAVEVLWAKYNSELYNIFEEAESEDFDSKCLTTDYEDIVNFDASQRCRDLAA